MLLTKKEIIVAYKRTKALKEHYESTMSIYLRLYKIRKKMELLSERYPDMMWSECPERKKQSVPLAFCTEKCVHKCADFMFIQKHNPKFMGIVNRLNTAFSNLLNQLEKREG